MGSKGITADDYSPLEVIKVLRGIKRMIIRHLSVINIPTSFYLCEPSFCPGLPDPQRMESSDTPKHILCGETECPRCSG